jgi:hypothetical protein
MDEDTETTVHKAIRIIAKKGVKQVGENGFFRESFLVTRDVHLSPSENLYCHSSYS